MNGPDEIPGRARLELQEDSLAVVELSARDSATFVSALLDPKPVNARLQDTVRRYRDQWDMRSEVPGRLYAKAYLAALYAERYINFYPYQRILTFIL